MNVAMVMQFYLKYHNFKCNKIFLISSMQFKISMYIYSYDMSHIKGALASKFVFGGAIGRTSPFLTGAYFLKAHEYTNHGNTRLESLEYRMKGRQNNLTTEKDTQLGEADK